MIAAGAIAYCNIFSAPFIFDDEGIVSDPRIRSLWPPWALLTGTTRPLTDLTFAVNYAVGASNVAGYHAVNLAVHLAAALLLFGIARRTLLTPTLQSRYGAAAQWIALAIALVWVVHPLQTESVTYTSQRAESLMGLFYLLTVYCVIRGAASARPAGWYATAVAACALGMASKPVMVTAPVVVLLYDRVFLAGSWRGAWRERGRVYLALAATWIVAVLILSGPHESQETAGFGMRSLTPLDYARTQPGVIAHYLRLVLWPHGLVLDYGWPVASGATATAVLAVVCVGVAILMVWAFRQHPGIGFLGAVFLLILAPSSSFIPIADLAFEHRMYLPLAPVIALTVVGGDALLRRNRLLTPWRAQASIGVIGAVVAVLTLLTIQRNDDYRSPVAMWRNVVARRPGNARGHNNLGEALYREGRLDEARPYYVAALELNPSYADAHNNLALILYKQGQLDAAAEHYREAVRLRPAHAEAHNNFGVTLMKAGQFDAAVAQYREALRLEPDYGEAHSNLGNALLARGRNREAVAEFQDALRVEPDSAEIHSNLGLALAAEGNHDDAIAHYAEAIRLEPDLAQAHHNMANSLLLQGRAERAVEEYRTALRLNPDSPESRQNLAIAVERLKSRSGS